MSRSTRIHAEYADAISNAADEWADHENMTQARVLRWLTQFEDADLPLALKVLGAIRYFGASNLRGMTRQLFRMVTSGIPRKERRRIGFVPIGDAGGGSATIARILKEMIRGTRHELVTILEAVRRGKGEFSTLVFVDDFSGTGETLSRWWETVEPVVLPLGVSHVYGILVMNEMADARLSDRGARLFSVVFLDGRSNVLSGANTHFTDAEKARILAQCVRTGVSADFQMGFGDCGLLVAFASGCPNNSLPILWYDKNGWRNLFNRRAI